MLIFPLEVDLSIIVFAKLSAEGEVSLENDVVFAEDLLCLEDFGDVDFVLTFVMIFLAGLLIPHDFSHLLDTFH